MNSRSPLLELPAELRLRIFEQLLQRPHWSTISRPSTHAAIVSGFTDGVGHVTMVREGDGWRSVSVAGPPGFSIQSTGILRANRQLHNEVMDLLYSKSLFVINIQNMIPIAPPFVGSHPVITASPSKKSMFLQWINHVHIRQHIRHEDELLKKAETLQSLLACLNPNRKTTGVTLHFTSMQLVDYGNLEPKPMATWESYASELSKMDLGSCPHVQTSSHWLELEGMETFEYLARQIGGTVNSKDFIYW